MPYEKVAHMLSILQEQATDMVHSIPVGVTYKDIVGDLNDHYGDHHLAADCRSQLKARIKLSGETLQGFAASVKQLAIPIDFVEKEAARTFISGVSGK
jgi:hypothetical protein